MARLFARLLEQHESRRHLSLLAQAGRERKPQPRPDPYDGFMPPAKAAEAMGLPVAEVADMARTGLLEWRQVGAEVYLRPAVVSRLAVMD